MYYNRHELCGYCMVVVWCERGFFHAHICLCEEKVVPSELPVMTILISLCSNELHTIPSKLLQKNVAYGNKNKLFLHIYVFFCTFAAMFIMKSTVRCINQDL